MAMAGVVDLTQEDAGDLAVQEDAPDLAPQHHHDRYHLRMWIHEPPLAKPSVRHGPGRGGLWRVYTDRKAKAKSDRLRGMISRAMTEHGYQTIPRDRPVKLTMWAFLRRPNDDFVSKVRGPGRLKESASSRKETIVPMKPDNDNLAKLLLDSLSGVLFVDDAQIVDLHIYKLRDSAGFCEGRLAIEVSVCECSVEDMMPNF